MSVPRECYVAFRGTAGPFVGDYGIVDFCHVKIENRGNPGSSALTLRNALKITRGVWVSGLLLLLYIEWSEGCRTPTERNHPRRQGESFLR